MTTNPTGNPTGRPAGNPATPDKIGRYQILGELGRGAMGRVYRAFDPNIGRNLAVKVIPLDTADPEMAMRFRREAQAAGVLSHPNIVTIFDAGDDGGYLYIAMELVEGKTLQQMLTSGPLPLPQVISYCEQAGAAIDHAHDRAIIHRDIKPANLMVQGSVVKITDFGVAKSGAAGMTSTGQVLGTPQYLAPEVVKGAVADARSDIFSFGVVLYEMLTGKRAFPGDNISTVIYRIISEQPQAPSAVIASLPPGLNYVVRRALAKEPEHRYASCAELVAELKNHPALAEKGVAAAQPASAPPPFPDMVANTVSINVSEGQAASTEANRTSPAAPSMRREKPWWVPAALYVGIAVAVVVGAILWHDRPGAETDPANPAPEAPAAATSSPDPVSEPAPPAAGTTAPAMPATQPRVAAPPPPAPAPAAGARTPAAPPAPATQSQPDPSPPPPAVAAMGRLVVHTEPPGARITVDGNATSYRTPVNFALAAGQHKITIEREGFTPETRDVVVESNRSLEVRMELEKTDGGGILRHIPFVR